LSSNPSPRPSPNLLTSRVQLTPYNQISTVEYNVCRRSLGGKFVKWTGRRKVEGGGTGEKAGLEALNHRHKYK